MEKWCVFFEIYIEYLNFIYTNFDFEGLIQLQPSLFTVSNLQNP
jgi:hypothetical protein